jgi:chromosome segregation ATPase
MTDDIQNIDLNDDIQERFDALQNKYDELETKLSQLDSTINKLVEDNVKLKNMISDKIPKFIFAELENKLNNHTKSIDVQSKKLFELQNNVHAFIQQPIAYSVIDNIRKQISDEIMENVNVIVSNLSEKLSSDIDTKNTDTRKLINNAKRFIYH